ncbi:hypothetical protein N7468_009574 [Penicillium chermesinum]|uniref:Uncharacterized protein n=1 Tax=Penicillium chermesinum TaxID=63820 RepID=A0A9W9TG96_9EURO|nr:uncharacterized protein N7468_009574 [Penicillium chermesinum]KAJ5220370.1 hypothetical protein N7468_009574 [Penicillium chermesinum]KAJ6157811.1 hypothetical protein N7470_005403 [Penicillium chermesinum]
MQFKTLISLGLMGSCAVALPGSWSSASSFWTSASSSATPTPSIGPLDGPPAVQAAESKFYADYNSFLAAPSGSAKQALYSKLNPDLQAIQSAKAAAWSSSAVAPTVSATPTPRR